MLTKFTSTLCMDMVRCGVQDSPPGSTIQTHCYYPEIRGKKTFTSDSDSGTTSAYCPTSFHSQRLARYEGQSER